MKIKNCFFTNKINVVLLALLVSALWGTLYPMIKVGYAAFAIDTKSVASIILFAGLRFFISGVILIAFFSARDKKIDLPSKGALSAIIVISLFTVVLQYILTYTGISMIESSKSSILKQIGFLILPAVMFLFRRDERFSIFKVLGALVGFCAVIILNLKGMNLAFGLGEILVILSSFVSAIGQIFSKHYYRTVSPTQVVAWGQLLGGGFMIVVGLVFGGKMGKVDLEGILVLGYMCGASICANLIWNTLIKYNDMSSLAVLKSADPLFASIFSALLLAESILSVRFLVALVLILIAIGLCNFNPMRKQKTINSTEQTQDLTN